MVAGTERAAQPAFHALGHPCKGGFAVERRKNGAADKGRAAQAGKNGAAEPLHGHAAAVDYGGFGSIGGKWRLMAKINDPGLASAMPTACRAQNGSPPNSTGNRRDSCALQTPTRL